MKKLLVLALGLSLALPLLASAQMTTVQGGTGLSTYAAGDIIYAGTINPIRFTKLNIGSNGTCLGVSGGLPAYISCGGGGGAGTGTISTSTNPVVGLLAQWTSPSTIGSIATSSLNLTTSSFLSPNISQWTNNAGYLTSAITSLNGLTGTTQTFATTSANGGWGFSSSGTTHTLNIPTASASNPLGLLSNTDWSTFNGKQTAGNYITALTGDVTASGPGSVASTLATVNGNVGSFTNANLTVNAKGLITAASNGSAGGGSTGTTTIFIDQNYTGGSSNGTIEKPYTTITSAIKTYPASYWVSPGTYNEASCGLNFTATSTINFNQAVILCWSGAIGGSGPGTITFQKGIIAKDGVIALGNVALTDTAVSDPGTLLNNYLGGGNLSLYGLSTVQGGQIIGGRVYMGIGSLTAMSFVEDNDPLDVAGVSNFDTMDINVSAVGAGTYAITSTSTGVVQMNGISLENTAANGGGIYCSGNGGTASQPNAISNLSGALATTTNSGAINCGATALAAGPYQITSTSNGQRIFAQATNPQNFSFLGLTTEGATTLAQHGGFVGIGTTTPSRLLDTWASGNGTTLTSASAATVGITNADTTANNFEDLAFLTADASGNTSISSKISGINTSHTGSAISGALAFLTKNAGTVTEKMRIMPDGVVDIGTTTDSTSIFNVQGTASTSALIVSGAGNSSGTTCVQASSAGLLSSTGSACGSGGGGITGTTGQNVYVNPTNTLAATSTIFTSTASKVGIATTTPTAQLDIQDAGTLSDVALEVYDNTLNVPGFQVKKVSASGFRILGNGFNTLPGVDSTGFSLLTSANAAQFLDAKGIFLGNSYASAAANAGQINTDTGVNLSLAAGLSTRMTISAANGFVGIATTTPSAPLTIATTTFANASTPIGLLIGSRGVTGGSANGVIFGIVPEVGWTGDITDFMLSSGATGLQVTSNGSVNTGNRITSGSGVTVATGSNYLNGNRGGWTSPGDGIFQMYNNAQTDFTRLDFGGTSSSFPALAKVGQNIVVQLADGTNGGQLAIGTSTPTNYSLLELASTTPTLDLEDTDGATNSKHLITSWNSGVWSLGTTSDTTYTSTSTALTVTPGLSSQLSIGSSTPTVGDVLTASGPSAASATKGTCFRAKAVGANTYIYWWFDASAVQHLTTATCSGTGTTTITYE